MENEEDTLIAIIHGGTAPHTTRNIIARKILQERSLAVSEALSVTKNERFAKRLTCFSNLIQSSYHLMCLSLMMMNFVMLCYSAAGFRPISHWPQRH
jgi:hypothetical protein